MVSFSEETEVSVTEMGYARSPQSSIGPDEVVFNLKDWNLKQEYTLRSDDKFVHRFDYALISTANEKDVIPINVLSGNKTERMDQIVILYLRTKNLSLQKRFALSAINVTPYENFLSGIFSVPIVKSIVLKDSNGFLRITPDGINEVEKTSSSPFRFNKRDAFEQEIAAAPDEKRDSINRRRRDHTKIIHDILALAKSSGEIGITKIIYKCNLNYRSALRAVNELLEGKLLAIGESAGAKQKYQITTEGLLLLDDLKKFNFIKG